VATLGYRQSSDTPSAGYCRARVSRKKRNGVTRGTRHEEAKLGEEGQDC
jgi:hypothetical protein